MTVKSMSKKDEKNELVFTWSNVDGEVRVFNSWSEMLEEENWEYLSNYDDSLDIFEAGILVKVNNITEGSGKRFFKDYYGKYWEYNEGVGEIYDAKSYVQCVPSLAREEVAKIKIEEL